MPGMPDPRAIQQDIRLRFGAPDGGAGALERAYRAIGEAEALNSRSGFIGQARGHYAGAYARYRRGDMPGTVAEATAASALAQAAIDERPPVRPRGLEAPPTPPARPSRPPGVPHAPGMPQTPGMPQPPAGMPPLPGMPPMPDMHDMPAVRDLVLRMGRDGFGGFGGGFSGEALDRLAAQENTPEVRTLVDRAKAAEAAAQRASTAGDRRRSAPPGAAGPRPRPGRPRLGGRRPPGRATLPRPPAAPPAGHHGRAGRARRAARPCTGARRALAGPAGGGQPRP